MTTDVSLEEKLNNLQAMFIPMMLDQLSANYYRLDLEQPMDHLNHLDKYL